jgi:transcription initiation factor TFIID subunit 2
VLTTGHSYFDVIKEPMDLSTMSAKLEAGQYKDLGAFELDFVLMISNCKHYNADGTYAFNEAIALDNFFRKGSC